MLVDQWKRRRKIANRNGYKCKIWWTRISSSDDLSHLFGLV